MKLGPVILLIPIFLLIPCLTDILDAQTTASGGLTGVITDPGGAVMPDASVEIRDNAKGTSQTTKTDPEGVYRFAFLTPGRYVLTVTYDGFRKERQVAYVLLGPPITVNVALKLATEANGTDSASWGNLAQRTFSFFFLDFLRSCCCFPRFA